MTGEWTENRPSRGFRRVDWSEVWSYRELIWLLTARDVRSRYKQTLLGILWAVGQPLAGTLALLLVFRRLIEVSSDGVPYIVFAFLGFSFWTYISGGVASITASLLQDAELITKVYFPRVAIPIAASLPGILDFSLSVVLLGVVMAITGFTPPLTIVLAPLCVFFAVGVVLGLGLLFATLNVMWRDIGHAVGLLTQLWFFISPVAYPSSLIKGGWRHVYSLNPVVGVLDLARALALGTPLSAVDLAISMSATVLLLIGGFLAFQRLERRFADVI